MNVSKHDLHYQPLLLQFNWWWLQCNDAARIMLKFCVAFVSSAHRFSHGTRKKTLHLAIWFKVFNFYVHSLNWFKPQKLTRLKKKLMLLERDHLENIIPIHCFYRLLPFKKIWWKSRKKSCLNRSKKKKIFMAV